MRYFPVALMPILAGIQQILEGHVWMGLNESDPFMVWWGAMGFIFFSWLIWPIWIPFSVISLNPQPANGKIFFLYSPSLV
tara:strand:- start:6153 stop:6392 length:240 start_codon:yes stop_codon:yes gene_type:complete